ncbi:MAG: dienelactone hydrolase family protein [Deltaproteobacteria bacterium]|nr:dienelactone hydrolase family protein [Deltaproteobacteria bacterium]
MTFKRREFLPCFCVSLCLLLAACPGDREVLRAEGDAQDGGSGPVAEPDGGGLDGGAPDAGPSDKARAAAAGKGSPNAPDPAILGPYPVGVATGRVSYFYDDGKKGEQRDIPVEIWYPADDAAAGMEKESLDLRNLAPAWLLEKVTLEMDPIPTDAVRDATVRRLGEAFPLVVFSHGAGGIRQQSVFFTVVLASHGFVVASPDHVGGTAWDLVDPKNKDKEFGALMAESMPKRLEDFAVVTDWMLKRNEDSEDLFFGVIEPKKVGAAGHSFGAFTAVAAAANRRFQAVVPMAPPSNPYEAESLARFPPVMIHGATKDKTMAYEQQKLLYDHVDPDKYLVGLKDGGHFSYTDLCSLPIADIAAVFDLNVESYMSDGCGEENIPAQEAHRLTNKFSVAFLAAYLRGSRAMYEAHLTSAAAALEPNVEFKSEEEF